MIGHLFGRGRVVRLFQWLPLAPYARWYLDGAPAVFTVVPMWLRELCMML